MYLESVKKNIVQQDETCLLIGVWENTRIMNCRDSKNLFEMELSWFSLLDSDDLEIVKNSLSQTLNWYLNQPFTITNDFVIEKITKQLNTLK